MAVKESDENMQINKYNCINSLDDYRLTKDDKSKDSQDYLLLPSLKLSKLSKEKLKMPADAEFPVPCFGSLLPASIVLSQLSPKIMRIWQLTLL